ncbi:hypothetical protein P153DRAFT_315688 [Dothidotthia symphoricarpi CBS 119687]|uniref:CPAF-like PDZ domain-containing protein n=1 Tax=Dothidotthia symphoricarpi CBS 119687 TaxID=1392245 RepID=A0A6A6AG27_9PLEO|nr:uncharacterized protein P153DRAFT_315688 [Dothidotthia symphoricarpi CBS 119687]KAF2130075.1 hypothetical protein P153DRAFT_315688 [Dothidotthia symphoricarpi CBS 119687]
MFLHQPNILTSLWSLFLAGALSGPTQLDRPKSVRARQQDLAASQSTACGAIIDDLNDGYAYHWASDAYACLTSVPFNDAVATRFIKYLNETLQFQSTLAYLKNPPTGYQQPAVDVLSELSKIQTDVTSRVYRNQYQFEIDVQHLLYRAHDAHLYLSGGITSAFSFLAPYSITAASSDGLSLPKVYLTSDVIESRDQGWTPSPIKTINNEDVVEYLTRLASLNAVGGIEPHADWNQLFYTPTLATLGAGSIWDSSVNFYPGDEIALTMENGTDYLDYWLALWNEPYATGPLTTGGDFYNYFVLGLLPASYNRSDGFFNPAYAPRKSSPPAATSRPQNSWRGVTNESYPDPDVWQEGLDVLADGIVSGYFLPDVDAAVLSIPSFGQSGYAIGNFSQAITDFIFNVTDANLTRVVIDLQQNTGGAVELAFSTFKRFFPDLEPFAGSRRRHHQLGNTIGEAYTAYFNGLTPEDAEYNDTLADEWVITPRLNAALDDNFTSWSEYSGPVQANGDSFSLTERYNLSSYTYSVALFDGWIPRGYTREAPLPWKERPFNVDDIVILTDAACSSTCALLVEMFTEAGVRTVTAGGRPTNGPIQAVGGNRGAVLYSADQIDSHIVRLSNPRFNVNDTILATLPQITETGYRDSGVLTSILAINLRDQVRPNDDVPLQFKYDAADCRVFYTLANVYNMSRLWRDTVTAAFDDPSLCVEDSTGYSNSSSNFTKSAPEPALVESYNVHLDLNEPDSVLIANDLDLSGGPQDSESRAFSYTIDNCSPNGGCGRFVNKQCEAVWLHDCRYLAGELYKTQRCVPYTGKKSNCPPGTTWQPENIHTWDSRLNTAKPAANGKSAGTSSGAGTTTGACQPNGNNRDLCETFCVTGREKACFN